MITIETLKDTTPYEADLIVLLKDGVDGGASVGFIAPLDPEIARSYWRKVADEAQVGGRVVLAALDGDRLVGCVHLVPATMPNGLHRADVQKMLVHSRYRRQGIARALLVALEQEAVALGRTLLVLDTERDSPAEALYERCGYQRSGIIPKFALNHDGSVLVDTVVFYRRLDVTQLVGGDVTEDEG